MKLKYTSLFVVCLLLLFTMIKGRPEPSDPKHNGLEGLEEAKNEKIEEKCEIGEGEEECLMRRTLVAHTDYIYTQGKHN
ncbi:hypothetical protein LUZ60_006046 [Juncus effusus]|nr:hypothetical protein LUZ60_006046 [Juncus effusus]